jgi:hypothetical protein
MATFKAIVRGFRTDGIGKVQIRCSHNGKTDYIKTSLYVHKNDVKDNEIQNQFILAKCTLEIDGYYQKLNRKDVERCCRPYEIYW